MANKVSEAQLDQAFAEAFEDSFAFRAWVLQGGRFAHLANESALLINEQAAARNSRVNAWWRWWWCRLPDGSESETDLFFVFQSQAFRFALHIENKPRHGKLTFAQAADYRRRAAFMSNDDRWLNYSDFETILLAPQTFIEENAASAGQFDRAITYEDVAAHAPLFEKAID
ncbi:hypothetical protein G6N82_10405 [Altererythrobacter sp. BO-6]|uniref:hypothetical protein n=1 Tax=Altererythrobacter sp. BO-6 TaxID=2604537 RepID=UPI0013E16FF3|nr:hypothetical protein [Altererythrobacter sp. BO-6]QIG54507.1 hypothetical protein G6N82_10405 [Altererythrobacter sp. BO-6]